MALEGLRPGLVEHVFAPGMRLDVQWHGAHELPLAPQHETGGLPARAPDGAAGGLQSMQVGVGDERVAGGQDIPGGRVEGAQVVDQFDGGIGQIASGEKDAAARPSGRQRRTSGQRRRATAIRSGTPCSSSSQ